MFSPFADSWLKENPSLHFYWLKPRHHIDMVWEKLAFDDAVRYTQCWKSKLAEENRTAYLQIRKESDFTIRKCSFKIWTIIEVLCKLLTWCGSIIGKSPGTPMLIWSYISKLILVQWLNIYCSRQRMQSRFNITCQCCSP